MEYIKLLLSNKSQEVTIAITRKEMKNVRLRVYPNGEIRLSAPKGVSFEWLNDFVYEKTNWIEKRLNEFHKTNGTEAINDIRSGSSIKLLGRDYFIIIENEAKKLITEEENRIIIRSSSTLTMRNKLYKWLRNRINDIVIEKLEKLYPIVKKHGVEKPKVVIRKMKTMWGNSNDKTNQITINYYLYKAKPSDIEYVILHELLHFVYPNHSKEFYELLSLYMPDWKIRKNNLDYEVIQSVRLM